MENITFLDNQVFPVTKMSAVYDDTGKPLTEVLDNLEGGSVNIVDITQAEYDALTDAEKNDGTIRNITDADPEDVKSELVGYDNTTSGLTATNIQDAIDEAASAIDDNTSAIAVLNGDSTTEGSLAKLKSDLQSSFQDGVNKIVTAINTKTGAVAGDDNYLDASSSPDDIVSIVNSDAIGSDEDIDYLSPDYTDTIEYNEGDVILKDGILYTALEDISSGAWDDSKWKRTYLVNISKASSSSTTEEKWKTWATKGGVDATLYNSMDELLNDEIATRKLMTKHASADYLYVWIVLDIIIDDTSTLDTIVSSENAMKWIGLRDYICDKMMSNSTIKDAMLESDNWEYILKDHVPNMTSNTAPYGEASSSSVLTANSYGSYEAYRAYKGLNSDGTRVSGTPAHGTRNQFPYWNTYKFNNPICVKKMKISFLGDSDQTTYTTTFKIQASNDNSTWIDLTELKTVGGDGTYMLTNIATEDINNDNYYMYYRVYITACSYNYAAITYLQYYGRSLNVSVPAMTSDNGPWGEAIYNNSQGTDIGYKAFDKDTSTSWQVPTSSSSSVSDNSYVAYNFTKKVKIKFATVLTYSDSGGACLNKFRLKASNDGTTWTEIFDGTNPSGTANVIPCVIDNDSEYQYYGVFPYGNTHRSSSNYNYMITEMNFYGVDYSEREYEEGSTMKYIYDHGVEFETLTAKGNQTTSKDNDRLYFYGSGSGNAYFQSDAVDLTNYNVVRAICDDNLSTTTTWYAELSARVGDISVTALAVNDIVQSMLPNSLYLDISSINTSANLITGRNTSMSNTTAGSINEWWLE